MTIEEQLGAETQVQKLNMKKQVYSLALTYYSGSCNSYFSLKRALHPLIID